MAYQDIPFGGRVSRQASDLVPIDGALEASDLILYDDTIKPRPGSRVALPTLTVIGNPGDVSQHLGRWRPDVTFARMVEVAGGDINLSSDPSALELSDGALTTPSSSVFANTAKISGAQLGKDYYLATDEDAVAWRRLVWTTPTTVAVQSMEALPQPAKPTLGSFSALTFTKFKDIMSDTPTVSGCVKQTSASTGLSALGSDWRAFTATNNGNDDPASGSTVLYKLTAAFDGTGYDWLVIAITPRDTNDTTGQIDVQLADDSGGSPLTIITVGSTYDVPPVAGSPNLLYVPLTGLTATVRAAIRYIKFVLTGSFGGKFGIYGYVFLPAKAESNPTRYYIDILSSNGQASALSEVLEVTVKDSDVVVPVYQNSYLANATFKNTGGNDDLFSPGNRRIFNREAGKDWPQEKANIGAVVSISGTAPTLPAGPTYLLRLWKDTSNGIRLVKSQAITTGAGYTIVDAGGNATLRNTQYKAGGTPPRCNALCATPSRLVAGYQSRIYVSSYVPPSATSSPFPQFPPEPIERIDGWAYDLCVNNNEQVQNLIWGDCLYVLSNLACYAMTDLSAPLDGIPPSKDTLFHRGSLGRDAAIWAEDRLFWASWDGVYQCSNRQSVDELSQDVRALYIDELDPDEQCVLMYQDRKLLVCQLCNILVYDFVTGKWLGLWTISKAIAKAYSFYDVST